MSKYITSEEHRRLATLFNKCGGDLDKIFAALEEEEAEHKVENYRVSLHKLKQKAPRDGTIFACHMIAGDYGGDSELLLKDEDDDEKVDEQLQIENE